MVNPATATDSRRLAEIDGYRVLDRPTAPLLQRIVNLTSAVLGVQRAEINLITGTEQRRLASSYGNMTSCPAEDSFCATTIKQPTGTVLVPDARVDGRFNRSPYVTGEKGRIIFYAATRLVTPRGVPIGTLCAFDEAAHQVDDAQLSVLHALGELVVEALEMRRSNESLSAFAGQVSHDLNNPLTSLVLSLRMLQESPTISEEKDLSWIVERAISGADRMQSLVGELLEYARLGGQLRDQVVDLDEVLSEVRADLASSLEGVEVVVDPLPTLRGDRIQLSAVVANLLSNAAKFRRPGVEPRVQVSAVRTLYGWRILFCDNGPGVPLALRQKVFEPLVRADTSTPGSGIGLATCRRVITAHGGNMGIDDGPVGPDSEPGAGAVVWFELPSDGPVDATGPVF